jgi:hypothetical protein
MKLVSSAFKNNEFIPVTYTCDGYDINPPLMFSELPEGTVSLALIVDDPDAPNGIWTHWTMWNINPERTTMISENSMPHEITLGTTSFGQQGYGGPCPPAGTHHYNFCLYALDTKLDLEDGANVEALRKAMEKHILESATLTGLYRRAQ